MSSKNVSLADKISSLLNAAPDYHPDEEPNEETAAKVVENDLEPSEQDDEQQSKFRKENVDFLDDVDEKYLGKKASRRTLKDSSDSESINSNDDEIEPIDQATDEEDFSDDEELKNSEESIDEEEEDDEELEDNEEEKTNFKHLKETNAKSAINSGLCVLNQLRNWENLLEIRIQLQKCLVNANRVPQGDSFKEMLNNNEFTEKSTILKKTIENVLSKFLELQSLVINKYPETKKLLKTTPKIETITKPNLDEDEEIPSDSEPENQKSEDEDDENEEENEELQHSPKKKLKTADFEKVISTNYKRYNTFRDTTIQKWNEKTQIAQGKNTNSQHSVLNQIQHNVSDKERLIKRTQLRRSEYKILGEDIADTGDTGDETSQRREYNKEIFDDDDFYHQLLRELIEVKSADVTDPIQLSRQWIQLQNMRSKMKRKIDTRATKGRKIRYGVHTKLVNFMAPIQSNGITDEGRFELFTSLFGKRHKS